MADGWIKLYRQIRDHWLWPSNRRYTNFEAWIDLLLSANHRQTTVNFGLDLIPVDRGQYLTTQVHLAKKWGWDRETVSKFLRLLEREKMTSIRTSSQTSTGYTLITIQNYERFQSAVLDEPAAAPASKPQANQQPTRTNKNDKKININILPPADLHFERAWKIYPKRAGSNSKKAALRSWTARQRSGANPEDMVKGVERYAKYVRAVRSEGTQFVKQAATFFGPDEFWKESWDIPAEPTSRANGGFVV